MEKFQDSLGTQLNITARSMRLALEKELSILGISPSQWMLLMALHEKDGQGQTELGKMVNLDNATITRSLDKLQEMELIARAQSQGDRRAQIVSLTPRGQNACKEWNFIGKAVNHRASKGMPAADKKKLLELLAKICGNLNGAGE
jgi:DNA-binding MarR family transcriptional regulator